jgi:hypothetical protein
MPKRRFIPILVSVVLVSLACRATSPGAFPEPSQPASTTPASAAANPIPSASAPPVPAPYQQTYADLNNYLNRDLALVGVSTQHYSTTFAAELIVADDNRGTALLDPQTLAATARYLDRLQSLGIKGVKSAIQYPLLTPTFPRYAEYLSFYRSVSRLIRERGMTWTIQASVLLANTPFSEFTYDFSGLTFEQFETQDWAMVQTIISELKPDYLSIIAEPETAATSPACASSMTRRKAWNWPTTSSMASTAAQLESAPARALGPMLDTHVCSRSRQASTASGYTSIR